MFFIYSSFAGFNQDGSLEHQQGPIPSAHNRGPLGERRSSSLNDEFGRSSQGLPKSMSEQHRQAVDLPLDLATSSKPRRPVPTMFSVAQETGQPVALTTKPGPPPPSTRNKDNSDIPNVPYGPPPAHGASSSSVTKTQGLPYTMRGGYLRPPFYGPYYPRFPADPFYGGYYAGMRPLRPGMMRNNSVDMLEKFVLFFFLYYTSFYNCSFFYSNEVDGLDQSITKTRSSEFLNDFGPRMPWRGASPFRPRPPFPMSPGNVDAYWMRTSPGGSYFQSPRMPMSGPPSAASMVIPRLPPGFKPQPGRLPPGLRTFIALYDYDPTTMSPNPDAIDAELPYKEGQLLKVYGERDRDGFYRGEACGRVGLIPGNMIQEVTISEQHVLDTLFDPANKREIFYRTSATNQPPGMLGVQNMLTTTQPTAGQGSSLLQTVSNTISKPMQQQQQQQQQQQNGM